MKTLTKSEQAKILRSKGWIVTDPSCNQMMKTTDDDHIFLFREDRISNPETKKTFLYESEIDLTDYTQKEKFECVQPFGYSFNEMCTWLEEGRNYELIAECIFEMEC